MLRVAERTLRWGSDYLVIPKLGFALALGGQPVADVANLSHRPVVDRPKPEPNGLCRQ